MNANKVVLGEELIPTLDRIKPILQALPGVQQQQILEILLVSYLCRSSHLHKHHRILMDGFTKHVWQLLAQAKGPRPPDEIH